MVCCVCVRERDQQCSFCCSIPYSFFFFSPFNPLLFNHQKFSSSSSSSFPNMKKEKRKVSLHSKHPNSLFFSLSFFDWKELSSLFTILSIHLQPCKHVIVVVVVVSGLLPAFSMGSQTKNKLNQFFVLENGCVRLEIKLFDGDWINI